MSTLLLLRYLDRQMKPEELSAVDRLIEHDLLLRERLEFIGDLRRAAAQRWLR